MEFSYWFFLYAEERGEDGKIYIYINLNKVLFPVSVSFLFFRRYVVTCGVPKRRKACSGGCRALDPDLIQDANQCRKMSEGIDGDTGGVVKNRSHRRKKEK